MAQLAKELKKEFTDAKLSYQWLHGDFDKPCLLLSIHILLIIIHWFFNCLPTSVCPCGSVIRFLPVPSKDVFPLTKLIPSRNNVHIATDSGIEEMHVFIRHTFNLVL